MRKNLVLRKPDNLQWRYPNIIFLVQWFSILTLSSFLAFIAISLKFVFCTESVRHMKHSVGHKSGKKTPFLWPTNESFFALTQCDKLVLRKRQKMLKKKTWSKLKITVLGKLDWGTLMTGEDYGIFLKIALTPLCAIFFHNTKKTKV